MIEIREYGLKRVKTKIKNTKKFKNNKLKIELPILISIWWLLEIKIIILK